MVADRLEGQSGPQEVQQHISTASLDSFECTSEAWSLEEDEDRRLRTKHRLLNPCPGDFSLRRAYDDSLKHRQHQQKQQLRQTLAGVRTQQRVGGAAGSGSLQETQPLTELHRSRLAGAVSGSGSLPETQPSSGVHRSRPDVVAFGSKSLPRAHPCLVELLTSHDILQKPLPGTVPTQTYLTVPTQTIGSLFSNVQFYNVHFRGCRHRFSV